MSTLVQPADLQQRRVWVTARIVMLMITLAMGGLLGRVVQLQLKPDPQIAARVEHRGTKTNVTPRRGAILDAKGRPLAVSRLGYILFADPKLIDPTDFAERVAHNIHEDPARIDRLISAREDRRYVVLSPLLRDEQVEPARQMSMTGVGLVPRLIRSYPQGPLAGQVLGFVGNEHRGLDGLEFALNRILDGEPGALTTLRDARRRPLWIDQRAYHPSRDGYDVRLSLDMVVQSICETELALACREHRCRAGEVIVLNPHNGQIMAMANWPPFDPNQPNALPPKQRDLARRNRCVTDPFEPGSIFKPFLHATASMMGMAKPTTMVDTGGGLWVTPYGRKLRDAHGHGTISWEQVLVVSSNIGMGKVCEPMGATKMYHAVRAFGFGQLTGADLPGESTGILNDLKKWNKYSLTSVPMGQEVGVTMLQMVKGFSAFANGGLVVSPSILAEESEDPLFTRAIDAKTAELTRGLMRRVVTEGTGRKADSNLYQVWGKTGTAQVPWHGGYKPNAYNASFVGGAPLNDPQIIVMVTLHEPDKSTGYYGGVVSAPVAKNVIEQTLAYMGVAPDNDKPLKNREIASGHQSFRD
jgi:cell division protein FtsI (penicillin-binding protein 3)